jgi:hypothetical protein
MEEIYLLFSIVFGIRSSNKNKNNFLMVLNRRMRMAGYAEPVYNKKYKSKGSQPPDYVVYGKLKQAKYVFVAPFDTCSRMFLPNYKYYPLNEAKNLRSERRNGLIDFIIIALCVGACALLLRLIGVDLSFTSIRTLFTLLPVIVFGIIVILVMGGIPNTHNFNRNSAALILMYAIANEIAVKKNAAFVFCNKSCSSLEGYIRLSRDAPEDVKKKFIFLNCIGLKKNLVLAHKEAGRNIAETIVSAAESNDIQISNVELDESEAQNTFFRVFPESQLLFGADKNDDGEYTVSNTRSDKDCEFDIDRIDQLKELFLKLAK